MIYKEGEVTFDINAQESPAKSTKIQFFTQDTGSAKLSFSFTKDGAPLPLSAVDAKIVLLYADDSFYKRSLTLTDKVNGKAEYVISDEELKHHGQVRAEVKLYYTNGQALATVFFTFSIAKTLEDQNIVPVAEYYIDDVESFRDQISQTLEEIKARFDEFENIETKAGAQEKADAAEANAKAYTDQHAAKTDNPHKVTKSQVGLANVDNVKQAAKTAFDTHVADNVRHITADERTKWNAAQLTKITADDAGVSLTIGDGDDFYDKVTKNGKRFGTFYSTGKAQNIPTTLSARGLFHMTSTINGVGSYGYVIAVDWKNNVFSNYVDGTLGWQGWRRFLTDADISPTWNSVNLINGAKQDSLYPLKFSVSNNVLWLRGSFGTLPAIGTSVAKFTNKPTQTVDFVVPTIGSYGTARFALTTDGDLRYDGMLANDETKVTRVSFNESIPLW